VADPASGAGRPRALLAISVLAPDAATRAEIAAGMAPRRDFDELADRLGETAELLFLDGIDPGSPIARVARHLLGERIGRRVTMAVELFRARGRYDVIFTDTDALGLPLALLMRLAGRRGCRHVTLTHNLSSLRNPLAATAKRALSRLGAGSAIDTMIVHSVAQQALAAASLGLPRERIVLLPYQVDTAFWQPLPAIGPGAAHSRPLILVPGHECRDYPTMVAALAGLDAEVRISTRQVTDEQAALAAAPGWPSNLSFHAYDYPALRQLYAESSFVIVPLLPVDFQAGITVILEAMAMGKAVIVSAISGQTDVVRDARSGDRQPAPALIAASDAAETLGRLPTGLYVTPGDPADLRAAIDRLLDDPDLADQLGRNGRIVAERLFSIESFAERFAIAIAGDAANRAGLARLRARQPLEV
jgi:glycosyltransferase involved in cell wall biosynthesis